jgi:hypothetical protein
VRYFGRSRCRKQTLPYLCINDDNDNNQNQTVSPLTHFSLLTRSPPFAVSAHTLQSLSAHPPLPVLFLPVIGRLMAVLLLHAFSPTVRKSNCSHALSEISYFYYLEKHGTFGVPNRILRGTGRSCLNPIKQGPEGGGIRRLKQRL